MSKFAPSVPDGYLAPVDRIDYRKLLEQSLEEVLREFPADTNAAVVAQAVCDSLRLPWEHTNLFDEYAIRVRLWPLPEGKKLAPTWLHWLLMPWRYERFIWMGMPRQYNSLVYVRERYIPRGGEWEGLHCPGLGVSHSVTWH